MNCSVVYKDELVSYNPITGEVEFVKDFQNARREPKENRKILPVIMPALSY